MELINMVKGWHNDRLRHSLARKGIKVKLNKGKIQYDKGKRIKRYLNDDYEILTSKYGKRYLKNVDRDRKRTAKPKGKRISASGNVYYEYRANRVDLKDNI